MSIRAEILIGASVAHSRCVQYAVSRAYVDSVSRVTHLVALDEAVQPRHHQPGGEAVGRRQRLAVHPDDEQRVPAVAHGVQRRADGEPVHGGAEELVGAVADAGALEDVGQPARPASGPSRRSRRRPRC